MRESKFSLRHVDFVELSVAFSGQWQGMGIAVKVLETLQKSRMYNWDSLEYRY